jgi:aminomethyltransferase
MISMIGHRIGELKLVDKTQVYEYHEKNGHIVEFAGFLMPTWYKGIIPECTAVRNTVGMFDVSHMGRMLVTGKDAETFLNYLTPNNVAGLKQFQGHYSVLCNEKGTIVDDIIVTRYDQEFFLVVFNASNRKKDVSWITEKSKRFNVKLDNISDEVAMFAVQGPKARDIIQKVSKEEVSKIPRFGCGWLTIDGLKCSASGTGYTGEDGLEVYVYDAPVEGPWRAMKVWNVILEAGKEFDIQPCGLGSRDVLRLEAGMCLYGNDIDETTTPLEARIGWVVKLDKPDFIGREPLAKQKGEGVKRVRVGMKVLGRGIPRAGYEILKNGKLIGKVTSGTLSPLLGYGIATGYVPKEYSNEGEKVEIKVRDRNLDAEIVKVPFYDTSKYGWQRKV